MENKNFTQSIFFIVLLGCLTAFDPLSIDMYLPAFSDIARDFQTSIGRVELSMSAFFIGMSFGQLFYGPFADRYGRKKPLLFGMILYSISTFGLAFAPTIEIFILLRILQALGGCAGMTITRAIVRDLYEPRKVAEFFSYMVLIMGIAPIVAPTVGGFVNMHFGWKYIFILLFALNLICFYFIWKFLPETNQSKMEVLNFKTTWQTYYSLLKDKSFVGYLMPVMFIRAAMFAYVAGSPFVFIELYKIPQHLYGIIFGLNAFGLIAATQVNRVLLRRFSIDQILGCAVKVAMALSVIVFFVPTLSTSFLAMFFPLFIFLSTLNFVGPNGMAGALSEQGHRAGSASALFGCLQWALASVSSYVVGVLHDGSSFPMRVSILGCGVCALVMYFIFNPGKRIQKI